MRSRAHAARPAQDDQPDEPAATPFDLENARLLLEQVRYLVDDERSFGEKLVSDRKIKLSVLAIIAGLGLLRPEFVVVLLELLTSGTIPGWIACVVTAFTAWALLSALVLVLAEAPVLRRSTLLNPSDAESTPDADTPDDAKADEDEDDDSDDDEQELFDPQVTFSAALTVLYGEPSEPDDWPDALAGIRRRVEEYRLAYARLAWKNRRVRKRLERGTSHLILGFVGVIILLVLGSAASLDDGHGSAVAPTKAPSTEGPPDA